MVGARVESRSPEQKREPRTWSKGGRIVSLEQKRTENMKRVGDEWLSLAHVLLRDIERARSWGACASRAEAIIR